MDKKNNPGKDFEIQVYHRFQNGLSKNNDFEVIRIDDFGMLPTKCDFVVKLSGKIIAVVEVKKCTPTVAIKEHVYMTLFQTARSCNSRFIIFVANRECYLQDVMRGRGDGFNDAITIEDVIKELLSIKALSFDADKQIDNVRKLLKRYGFAVGLRKGSLRYNTKMNTVSFSSKIEENLWQQMVGKTEVTEITRFSTLDTLFATLDKESFRMMALEGMNDKEEGDFLWKNLYGKDTIIDEYKDQDETTFIMSCSAVNELDLNMWRLYAEDTKGMCLKLSVDKDKIKDYGFTIAKVVYSGGKELACLKDLVRYFKELPTPVTFILQQWNKWRPFFKSKDYEVEQEIRLLYLKSEDNKEKDSKNYTEGWVLTNDCKVFSEYVDFKGERAQQFPLKIEKIYLGSNSPEKETNKKQALKLFKQKAAALGTKYDDGIVEISKITSYRTGK